MMKQLSNLFVLVFTCLALSVGGVNAQPEHRLLIQMGVNSSSQSYSTSETTQTQEPTYESNTRFTFGLGYGLKSKRFAFSAELNYTQLGATSVATGSAFGPGLSQTFDVRITPTYEYLEVPIQFGFYAIDEQRFRLKLSAGPWLGLALGGKQIVNGTVTTFFQGFGSSTETFSETTDINVGSEYSPIESRMKPIQFGILGGMGLEYVVNDKIVLGLEPRYLIGLSDITPDQNSGSGSSVDESIYHRVFSVMLRAGIRL